MSWCHVIRSKIGWKRDVRNSLRVEFCSANSLALATADIVECSLLFLYFTFSLGRANFPLQSSLPTPPLFLNLAYLTTRACKSWELCLFTIFSLKTIITQKNLIYQIIHFDYTQIIPDKNNGTCLITAFKVFFFWLLKNKIF